MTQVVDVATAIRELFGKNAILTPEEIEARDGIAEVIARDRGHKAAKNHLGGRVQVLRLIIHGRYRAKQTAEGMSEWEYCLRCEKYLDNILIAKKYRIEDIITKLRKNDDENGV
jgi:hypothetical protein